MDLESFFSSERICPQLEKSGQVRIWGTTLVRGNCLLTRGYVMMPAGSLDGRPSKGISFPSETIPKPLFVALTSWIH